MWPGSGCCVGCVTNEVSVELLLLLWLSSTLDRRDILPPGSSPAPPELLVEEGEENSVGEGVEAAGAVVEAVLEARGGVMGEESGKGVMEEPPGSGWE